MLEFQAGRESFGQYPADPYTPAFSIKVDELVQLARLGVNNETARNTVNDFIETTYSSALNPDIPLSAQLIINSTYQFLVRIQDFHHTIAKFNVCTCS